MTQNRTETEQRRTEERRSNYYLISQRQRGCDGSLLEAHEAHLGEDSYGEMKSRTNLKR